jgi:hypothetical protein
MSYWVDPSDLEEYSNEELLTFYQNAASTDCGSIGHSKGHRNKMAAQLYEAEMKTRKVDVPDYYVAASAGDFNGRGST